MTNSQLALAILLLPATGAILLLVAAVGAIYLSRGAR